MHTLRSQNSFRSGIDLDLRICARLANHRRLDPKGAKRITHLLRVILTNLHQCAQLLGEQSRADIVFGHLQLNAATPCKGHLESSNNQPTVTPVVVGKQPALIILGQHTFKEGFQRQGIVDIGNLRAQLPMHLRQSAAPKSILAKLSKHQHRVFNLRPQLRRKRQTNVRNRRKRSDIQRQWRHNRPLALRRRPGGAHRQAVLAHRNCNSKGGAKLHTHGLDGFKQGLIFLTLPRCGHPVGRQHDPRQPGYPRSRQIRERFTDGHARRRGRIQGCKRGPLTHAHGLAGVGVKARCGDSNISNRFLPGSNHLLLGHQARDAAIADGDEELLAAYRREAQHFLKISKHRTRIKRQFPCLTRAAGVAAFELRRVAEQHIHGQINRVVFKKLVAETQMRLAYRLANHRVRTPLPGANRLKQLDTGGIDSHDVTLLGFVAPDLHRRHTRISAGHPS